MTIRDIILHVDSQTETDANQKRQDYAISMAQAFEAHLTGVAIALEPMLPPMVMGELPVSVLETQRQRLQAVAQHALDAFEERARKQGISYERNMLSALEASASEAFAGRMRTADLAIIGQEEPDEGSMLHSLLIESALFESGRPVLILPYIGPDSFALSSCLIAWDGSREAARAVHDALPLIGKSTSVEILVVDTGQFAVDDEPGAALATHLARHGLKVNIKVIPAGGLDVASAILSYTDDVRPDLVIMGGYGHSRLREFLMGGATRGMLRSMTAPVFMAH